MSSVDSGRVATPPRPLRRIGALAGLAPAVMILGWYFATGGPLIPGLALIVAACVVAGWLVGPCATGPIRADVLAMFGFFVIGYLLHSTAGIGLTTLLGWQAGAAVDPHEAFREAAAAWLARVAYLPVFGVFLSPAALAWLLTLRTLRGRFRRPNS